MQTTKKREEQLVTELFLNKLNEAYGTSYAVEPVSSEHTRIDTRGVSPVPGEDPINFQLTYADNGLPHEGGSVLRHGFRARAGNVVDLTTPYDVAAAIERKQERYGRETAGHLVLLVWKTKSCQIDAAGTAWKADHIWFKGCYFVCLPGGGMPGQVLALKPLVAADGRAFDLQHGRIGA